MTSLQKLLGNEDQFFDLLEASAGEAVHSVAALKHFLEAPDAAKPLADLIAARRKEKSLSARIGDALCTTFVSSLEREDIAALSNSIYKIPKTIEKIAERMLLAPQHLAGANFAAQVAGLEKASAVLLQMVKELRKGMNLTRVRARNEELQAVEGEADKVLNELVKGLYNSTENPGRVVFLKEMYELLERVTDRCRDAGNVITQIVLKNS